MASDPMTSLNPPLEGAGTVMGPAVADIALTLIAGQHETAEASGKEAPITQAELIDMFGEAMPIEAWNLIADEPGDRTIGQVRAKLREIAASQPKGPPDVHVALARLGVVWRSGHAGEGSAEYKERMAHNEAVNVIQEAVIDRLVAPPAGPLQRVEEGASRDHDPSTFATLQPGEWTRRGEAHVTGRQPIETAPRDGSPILGLKDASWVVVKWVFPRSSRTPGYWATVPGSWQVKPTYWMPLPSAPGDGAGDCTASTADRQTGPRDALDTVTKLRGEVSDSISPSGHSAMGNPITEQDQSLNQDSKGEGT